MSYVFICAAMNLIGLKGNLELRISTANSEQYKATGESRYQVALT
jgi:hypothetical protein